MRRSVKILFSAVLFSVFLGITAFAGQWQADGTGWWYQNADGTYLTNGWYWIDGANYYFNEQGYRLSNTVTPDGYTVDANGAWVLDGVMQTRMNAVNVGTLTAVIPNGYDVEYVENGVALKETNGDNGVMLVSIYEESIPMVSAYFGEPGLATLASGVADGLTQELATNPALLNSYTNYYASGTWYTYQYLLLDESGFSRFCDVNLNFSGSEVRVVLVVGNNREFTTDTYLSSYVY